MFLYLAFIAAVILVLLTIFILTRKNQFNYVRSGVIQAPAEKIFPYLKSFQLSVQWSPYEKLDPKLRKSFYGDDGEVGSVMTFDGNVEVGSGRLEILKIETNQLVEIHLKSLKPFETQNRVQYRLTPEGHDTRFTWSMSGRNGFLGKMINVFVDCDKLAGDQFTAGIDNLRNVVEKSG